LFVGVSVCEDTARGFKLALKYSVISVLTWQYF